MEHTTVPQICVLLQSVATRRVAQPHDLYKRCIACSVCTVDLAFRIRNVMQRKEILLIIS